MEEKELIILAIYINTGYQSQAHTEQMLKQYIEEYDNLYYDVNKNVKVYWFPVRDEKTRIECVYPPPNIVNDKGIVENELLKIYKFLLSSTPIIDEKVSKEIKNMIKNFERKLKLTNLKKN